MRKKLLFAIPFVALAACTKVINPDLNSADPRLVIEAELVGGRTSFEVKISRTGDYFGTSQPTPVTDATVTLTETGGSSFALANAGGGRYTLDSYTGKEGTSYTLTVETGGETYTAVSQMPVAVPLDSLTFKVKDQPPFGSLPADSLDVYLHFKDPVGVGNYYRFRSTVNGVPHLEGDKLELIDDRLVDGNQIQIPLWVDSFEANDSVRVELISMDRAGYDYFNTLLLIVSDQGGGSAAPTNPTSNWSGGALGHFSAVAVSEKTRVLR